jgi:hypothetical protein
MGLSKWCCGNAAVFYLWANLSVTAIWLLGVLLGVQLISEGPGSRLLGMASSPELNVTNRSERRSHPDLGGRYVTVPGLNS